MDLWGYISGPLFPVFYVGVLIVPVSAGVLWAWISGRGRALPDPGTLDPYEVALLSGGRDRVADTVIAAMIEQRRLRVEDDLLFRTGTGYHSNRLFNAATAFAADGIDANAMKSRLRDCDAMSSLERRLVRHGLVVNERGRRRGWRWVLAVALVVSGFCGTVLLANVGHDPGSAGGAALWCGLGIPLLMAAWGLKFKSPLTRTGRRALDEVAAAERQPASAVLAVALGGFDKYPDDALREALQVRPLVPRGRRRRVGAAVPGSWYFDGPGSASPGGWYRYGGGEDGSGGYESGSYGGGGGFDGGGGGGGF